MRFMTLNILRPAYAMGFSPHFSWQKSQRPGKMLPRQECAKHVALKNLFSFQSAAESLPCCSAGGNI